MKVKEKVLACFIIAIIMFVMLIPNTVNAAYSATIDITANKTEYNPSDTVDLTFKLKDMREQGTGVLELMGTIEYDSNVFSSTYTVSGGASLTPSSNVPNELYSGNSFIMSAGSPITTNDSVFGILQLKVKDDARLGDTTIKFTQLVSAVDNDAESPDITINLNIAEKKASPSPSISPSSNPPTTPSTTPSSTPTNPTKPTSYPTYTPTAYPTATYIPTWSPITPSTSGNVNYGNGSQQAEGSTGTEAPGVLPKAGIKAVILVLIALLAVSGGISFVYYRKYRNL